MIIHVPGNEKYSDWMVSASKEPGLVISLINAYGFLNAATGYGWQSRPLAKCGLQRTHLFFSSEGLRGRLQVVPDTWQPINKYILNRRLVVNDISSECYKSFKYYVFNRQFLFYTVLLAVFITALAVCGVVGYTHLSQS